MISVRAYQDAILEGTEKYRGHILPPALRQAFLDCPRHLFVSRYQSRLDRQWYEVGPDNLKEHLPHLYANDALLIYQQPGSQQISTISQPSLVLEMLALLDLKPGHKVLEIGTGSGWNAALMGKLVGEEGQVYTLELIGELAQESKKRLQSLSIQSVTVLEGDGGEGYPPAAPFDRIVFTAGAYDIPLPIHQQLREGGLLLAVIKIPGGGDNLFLLRKEKEGLRSTFSAPVAFIPMLGKYHIPELEAAELGSFLKAKGLPAGEFSRTPFWWGGQGQWSLMRRTEGLRSFFYLALPGYQVFRGLKEEEMPFFGVYDHQSHSLVVAREDMLLTYGNAGAKDKLLQTLKEWVKLGMPASTSFQLEIFPKGCLPGQRPTHWVLEREDSLFIWQLLEAVQAG